MIEKRMTFIFKNSETTTDAQQANQQQNANKQSLYNGFKTATADSDTVRVTTTSKPAIKGNKKRATDYKIEKAPDEHISCNQIKQTILSNNFDEFKFLHRNGFDLTKRLEDGKTLIHFAASDDMLYDILKYLVDRSTFTFYAKDNNNQTPLHIACEVGSFDAAYLLASAGKGLNTKDTNNNTPLSIAISKGYTDIACMLIDNTDIKLETKHSFGDNLLHLVARAHYTDNKTCKYLVELLIANKAPISAQNTEGKTAYQLAFNLQNQLFIDAYVNATKLPSVLNIKETSI